MDANLVEFYDDVYTRSPRKWTDIERDYIAHVLRSCDGNRSAAARALGIGRNTLARKLR